MVLRGAIVGVGNVALGGHLPAWLDDPWLSRKVRIVAAADPSPANLAALAERLPGVAGFASVDQLLDAVEVDFLDVCAPPHTRLPIVEAAVRHGRHLLCEKPLAARLEDGLEIGRRLDRQPLVARPCHQYLEAPLWRMVGEQIRSGAIGAPRLARFDVLRPRADPGDPRWPADWRRDPGRAGGGIVFDLGVHYFYLVSALFGRPTRVQATVRRLTHGPGEGEDTALILLECPAGLIQINLSWAADRRENGLVIVGSGGRIELRGELLSVESAARPTATTDLAGTLGKAAYPSWYAALFRRFAEDIEARCYGREPLAQAIDGLLLASLVYRSGETGTALSVPPPPD